MLEEEAPLDDDSFPSGRVAKSLSSSPQAARHRNATRAKIPHFIAVLLFYTM
jgi:hypothetical protein